MDEEAALIEADRILLEDYPDKNELERRIEEEETITMLARSMLAVNITENVENPLEFDGYVDEGWQVRRPFGNTSNVNLFFCAFD